MLEATLVNPPTSTEVSRGCSGPLLGFPCLVSDWAPEPVPLEAVSDRHSGCWSLQATGICRQVARVTLLMETCSMFQRPTSGVTGFCCSPPNRENIRDPILGDLWLLFSNNQKEKEKGRSTLILLKTREEVSQVIKDGKPPCHCAGHFYAATC